LAGRSSAGDAYFTPTGSSWINQIETWFGIITRQAIRRGTFNSVKVLIKRIRDEAGGSCSAGPVPAVRPRRVCRLAWSQRCALLGSRILRKDLRVKSLPLPFIVHAAAAASKAATPSLRDACGRSSLGLSLVLGHPAAQARNPSRRSGAHFSYPA
jgi:hypothetical protein